MIWRDKLIMGKRKEVKAILANALIALRDHPEFQGIVRFDTFRQRTTICGQPPWSTVNIDRDWQPIDDLHTTEWIQNLGIAVGPDIVTTAVEVVAQENNFHPVIDYLSRCKWDGEPRLDQWTIQYLGADDSEYTRAISAKWMISAIARIMQPGCKADCALILEGKQGILKSTALKTLSQPWFADEIAELGSKDAAMQLVGAWIIEMAELDSVTRAEVSRIKAFLSRTSDRFRPPWGRRIIEQPRQCIFAGTVNNNQYLRDETGGRRFWPLPCSSIDVESLALARDQLWAEARDRYESDEVWWINNGDVRTEASHQQEARRLDDPWQAKIEPLIGLLSSTTAHEVLDLLNVPVINQDQLHANRVASCLKALGWARKSMRYQGKSVWRWVHPEKQA